MYIKVKSRSLKRLQKIERNCRWHRFFVIWPRKISTVSGYNEFAFLTFVYRKAKLCVSRHYEDYSLSIYFNFVYAKTEQEASMSILSAGDEIKFRDEETQNYYEQLKEQTNED